MLCLNVILVLWARWMGKLLPVYWESFLTFVATNSCHYQYQLLQIMGPAYTWLSSYIFTSFMLWFTVFGQTECDEFLNIYKKSYDDIYHTVCFLVSLYLCKLILSILKYVVRICCADFFVCVLHAFLIRKINSLLFLSVLLVSNLVLSYALFSLSCPSILVC